MFRICFYTLLIIGMTACGKMDSSSIQWEELSTGTSERLCAGWFFNDSTGFVCGGDKYEKAVLLFTEDAGATWEEIETGIEKIIYDIHFFDRNRGIAVAMDSKMLYTEDGGKSWYLWQQHVPDQSLQPFRSIHFADENLGFVVGGSAFNQGVIFRTTNGGKSWDMQWFKDEISDVFAIDQSLAYACGYGTIYQTKDGGDTWELLSAKGDFFRSIHFPEKEIGYAVGAQGAIVKTSDGGENWQNLRKADYLFQPSHHYEKVFFKDAKNGYIIGEKVFITTNDGGESWKQMEGLDFERFNDLLFFSEQEGLLLGDGGRLVLFSFPF